jgi:pyruvate formate lyase activating enzyme
MKSSIDSIETFSTVDGPGIRTVVFFNECKLRCIYCHNPEMWCKQESNMTSDELVEKILHNKEYFGKSGGVTFSGGEPLLHVDFLIEVSKKLKEYNIHIAIDTAGVGIGKYEELLNYIDLIIFDVKHTTQEGYKKVTRIDTNESLKFLNVANKLNKKFWVRQVIVPGIMDNDEYLYSLKEFLDNNINNIEKIEFLPYHKLGEEKFKKLNIPYPCKDIPEMDKEECNKLYNKFMSIYKN